MSDIQRKVPITEPVAGEAETPVQARTALSSFQSPDIPRSELSKTGKEVVEDIEKVTKDTQQILQEKIRPAAAEAQTKVEELTGEKGKGPAEEGQSMITEELQFIMNQLKSGKEDFQHVAKLLFYSPNFRKVFFEFASIIQEALRDIRYEYKEGESKKEVRGKEPSGELEQLEAKLKPSKAESKGKKESMLSDQAMDNLANKFTKWLRTVHDAPEFVEAFEFLRQRLMNLEGLSLFNLAVKDKSELTGEESKMLESIKTSDALKIGLQAKIFVEHWVNCSLDPLLKGLESTRKSLMKDEEAKKSLSDLSQWFQSCLKDSSVDISERSDQFKSQVLDLRSKVAEKHRGDFNHLVEETSAFVERAKRDELSVKLSEDLQDLFNHLFRDESGNLTIKPELWTDLKAVLPVFFHRLRFIQVPEILVKDESVDFVANGITISVGELAPKSIQAHFYSDLDIAKRDLEEAIGTDYDLESIFIVEAGKIYAEARNVFFDLDKKSFPPLSDSGVADLNIHGDEGMRITLVFGARRIGVLGTSKGAVGTGGFKLIQAKCAIDQLDLRLHETRHGWMYAVLGPLIRRQLKSKIEEAIESYLLAGEWMESLTNPASITEALKSSII